MSDAKIRRLERDAATGDMVAQVKLEEERRRHGLEDPPPRGTPEEFVTLHRRTRDLHDDETQWGWLGENSLRLLKDVTIGWGDEWVKLILSWNFPGVQRTSRDYKRDDTVHERLEKTIRKVLDCQAEDKKRKRRRDQAARKKANLESMRAFVLEAELVLEDDGKPGASADHSWATAIVGPLEVEITADHEGGPEEFDIDVRGLSRDDALRVLALL